MPKPGSKAKIKTVAKHRRDRDNSVMLRAARQRHMAENAKYVAARVEQHLKTGDWHLAAEALTSAMQEFIAREWTKDSSIWDCPYLCVDTRERLEELGIESLGDLQMWMEAGLMLETRGFGATRKTECVGAILLCLGYGVDYVI